MQYVTEIIRSKRKTVGFEISRPGVLTVRVPNRMSRREIASVIARQQNWIEKHMCEAEKAARRKETLPSFTEAERERMRQTAKEVIPERVQRYALLLGVSYGRITIRNQRTRWGSCSEKGNLNFNCLLMEAPECVLDYVVVHELCHRLEMNHSKRFWSLVESVLPDYRERRKWLNENGRDLMERMREE